MYNAEKQYLASLKAFFLSDFFEFKSSIQPYNIRMTVSSRAYAVIVIIAIRNTQIVSKHETYVTEL